ncbi:MAG: polyketide synthase [Cyanobacteria bacterium P01_F01_bin.116]
MDNRELVIKTVGDGIASIQIATDDNPHEDVWFVSALNNAVEILKADQTVRCVIFEGDSRYFSAGGSRSALVGASSESSQSETALSNPTEFFSEVPRLLLSIPVPTVASMAGHAIGGGLATGLWCDLVVLAEESLYGANFMALGFTPGMGTTTVLEDALGGPLARELLFTGRLLKGREIKASGGPLAHAVVPYKEVRHRVMEIASEIAEVPREALVLLKETLSAKRRMLLESAIKVEVAMQNDLFSRSETRLRIAQRYPVANSTMFATYSDKV